MNARGIALALVIAGSGGVLLIGQQPQVPRVFTAAQAEAGRIAYENSCGKCHAYTLLGRSTPEDGLPPVNSLPDFYQEFVRKTGRVPPLAGKAFLSRWGDKSVAALIQRFQVTAGDSFFQFQNMTPDTTVNITAYALEVSGARPGDQALTRTNTAIVNSLIP